MARLMVRLDPQTQQAMDSLREEMGRQAGKKVPFGSVLDHVTEALAADLPSIDWKAVEESATAAQATAGGTRQTTFIVSRQTEAAVASAKAAMGTALRKQNPLLPLVMRLLFAAYGLKEQGALPLQAQEAPLDAAQAQRLMAVARANALGFEAPAVLGGADVYLASNGWVDSTLCTPDEPLFANDPAMAFPAFDRRDGAGFYNCFWPELWAPVRQALADGPRRGLNYGYPARRDNLPRGFCLAPFAPVFGGVAAGDSLAGVLPAGEESPEQWLAQRRWLVEVSPVLVREYQRRYRCLANYLPLPAALGDFKGKSAQVRGFPDVFLEAVRLGYVAAGAVDGPLRQQLEECRSYFARFGEGEAGWQAFARQNYLLGSFVDEAYGVVPLFPRPQGLAPAPARAAMPRDGAESLQLVNTALLLMGRRARVLAEAAGSPAFMDYLASTDIDWTEAGE